METKDISCEVENKDLIIKITLKADGDNPSSVTWREVLARCVDTVKGLGFISDEFDELLDKYDGHL